VRASTRCQALWGAHAAGICTRPPVECRSLLRPATGGRTRAACAPRSFKPMQSIITLLPLTLWLSVSSAADNHKVPGDCGQCLVVTTPSWSSPKGKLVLFERDANSGWHQHGTPFRVLVGRSGLAWGRGLLNPSALPGPIKIEGDDKAPAGIFRLRCVFGYARDASIKMPYLALSENIVAIDDPRSRYYNQLIDKSKIKNRDWRSAEKMILADDRYKWGVFVEHNLPPRSGAGSCIFLQSSATSPARAIAGAGLSRVRCEMEFARFVVVEAVVPTACLVVRWLSQPPLHQAARVPRWQPVLPLLT
jgi:L,D-peptidoglycan transpeptidase YkuD (ErfK/YbiS/YcfS/YnhG family)